MVVFEALRNVILIISIQRMDSALLKNKTQEAP